MIINKFKILVCICSLCSITPFVQLVDISHKKFILLKTYDSEFSYIEVCFTDQNSKLPEIDDKINFTLVIN